MPCSDNGMRDMKSFKEILDEQGVKRSKTSREKYDSLLRHHQAVEKECEQWRKLFKELRVKVFDQEMKQTPDWDVYTYRDENGVLPTSGSSLDKLPEDWLKSEDYKGK